MEFSLNPQTLRVIVDIMDHCVKKVGLGNMVRVEGYNVGRPQLLLLANMLERQSTVEAQAQQEQEYVEEPATPDADPVSTTSPPDKPYDTTATSTATEAILPEKPQDDTQTTGE